MGPRIWGLEEGDAGKGEGGDPQGTIAQSADLHIILHNGFLGPIRENKQAFNRETLYLVS